MSRRHLIVAIPLIAAGCATQPIKVEPGRHITMPALRPTDLPQPIERPVFLPTPTAQTKTDTYSVVVSNVPVRDLMFALARDAKLNVDVHPLIKGSVTINALNQTLPQILERVSRQIDMRYTLDHGVLSIVPDRPYIKTYSIDYVNVSRSAKSNVSISTSVAGVGGSVTGGGGSQNSSNTEVSNVAENKFWDRLESNIRALITSTRRVSQEEKTERDELEAKDEESRNADAKEQKASKAEAEKQDRLKVAQVVASAGSGASQLFASVEGGAKTGATKGGAGETKTADDVFVHPETGVVTINATSREHAKVQEYIDRISASAKRQVLIEATIVEVALNNQYQAGIDWKLFKTNADGTLQDNRLNIAQASTSSDVLAKLPLTLLSYSKKAAGLFNGADFTATIKALEQFGKTKVLSSPKIMALNNQTALLKVVDEKVYFTIKLDVTPATTTTVEKREYTSELHTIPVGMVMSVTPQIGDNDSVSLNIRPTISHITGYKSDPALALVQAGLASNVEKVQSLVPEIQVREVESTLRLANGQSAILGGLIQDQIQTQRDGMPGLSRLPWGLGDLFSYRDDAAQKTELVIFMRPVIVRDASLNGDLADYRNFVPKADFFQSPQDELSVFKSGQTAQ